MPNLAIEKTKLIASYLRSLYNAEVQGKKDDIPIPNWPLHLLEDCHYAVQVVSTAVKNQRRTQWSVEEYIAELKRIGPRCSGQQETIEANLRRSFPPLQHEIIADPCVVGDQDGCALTWYLPGIISPGRQKLMSTSVKIVEGMLEVKQDSSNWRVNGDHYRPAIDCQYRPGTMNFAIAWYQQAMRGILDLEVAAKLRKPPTQVWVHEMEETCAFLGGILSIINPTQYESGIAVLESIASRPEKVAKSEHLEQLLQMWTSPYPAFSIISNRDSPLHRDNGGGYASMDMLASVGNYDNGRFRVPGLGVEFWYRTGSVIGVAGRVVQHGASAEGERLCIAQYTRENVLHDLAIQESRWTRIQDINRTVGPHPPHTSIESTVDRHAL